MLCQGHVSDVHHLIILRELYSRSKRIVYIGRCRSDALRIEYNVLLRTS